jgi:pimeloyl-ACP methyl ester carboxylesterase
MAESQPSAGLDMMDQDPTTSFIPASGYRLHLRQIEGERTPTLVFLHEGLGTIGVWGDVPDALCRATDCPGVIYERPGYGTSDPRPLPWPADALEQEAEIVLPALLEALPLIVRCSSAIPTVAPSCSYTPPPSRSGYPR